jgi:hypothetical protein
MTWPRRTLTLAIAGALAGCLGDPKVGGPIPIVEGPAGTFSSISQTILTPRCATSACHSGNPPANGVPVSLDAERAWADLVSVPSTQLPTMNLVEPGHPETSYLVLKLQGTQAIEGGTGSQMPIGADALTPDELSAIAAWITNGAPND